MARTTIGLSIETKKELDSRKIIQDEKHETIIKRLLEIHDIYFVLINKIGEDKIKEIIKNG